MPSDVMADGHDRVALIGATLIDGTGKGPVAPATVLIKSERIVAAGSPSDITIPKGYVVKDFSGKWLIPGLIDAHIHIFESGRIYMYPHTINLENLVPYDQEIAWVKNRLEYTLSRYLCAGVTSALSLAGINLEYQAKSLGMTRPNAPRIFVAGGPIINVPAQNQLPKFDGQEVLWQAMDERQVRAKVAHEAKKGAELIKVGYLDSKDYPIEKFALLMAAIVDESHKRGLKVGVHATELAAAKAAIRAGADFLAHTVTEPLDDEFIQLAVASKIINVSTLAVWDRYEKTLERQVELLPIEKSCGDPQVIESWEAVKTLPAASGIPIGSVEAKSTSGVILDNIRRLHQAGVDIAVGSDAGNIGLLHGASLHQELALMAKAGIQPLDIIVAATRNGARAAGQEKDLGTIEAGKLADIVILDADPLRDIHNMAKIRAVLKGRVMMVFLP